MDKINYTVFNTFLSDRWKVEQLPDEVAGKIWKALVRYFCGDGDTDFGNGLHQYIYEDFKQTNIRNAERNKKKNENRKLAKQGIEPTITVDNG